jgi:thiamine-phosphate pyrophosphorylase
VKTHQERLKIPRGLYAITPDQSDTSWLVSAVAQAIEGGIVALQYRNKVASVNLQKEQAIALQTLCQKSNIPLIVNDDVLLAQHVGAAGVHLGIDDGHWGVVAEAANSGLIVGVSCYADFERAQIAAKLGASYVAFGAFFSSATKPLANRAAIEVLNQAQSLSIPVCAIGGITYENAPPLIAAGADNLAVINDLFGASDVYLRAKQLKSLWQ